MNRKPRAWSDAEKINETANVHRRSLLFGPLRCVAFLVALRLEPRPVEEPKICRRFPRVYATLGGAVAHSGSGGFTDY
jgi:hypothetical protein